MKRAFSQIAIATSPHGVVEMVCVCTDGTAWRMQETGEWTQIKHPPDYVPEYLPRDPANFTTQIQPDETGIPGWRNTALDEPYQAEMGGIGRKLP
jgi:hypothetical protein